MLPSSSGSACYLLHADFLLRIFFDPEDGGDMSPKCLLTLSGLHGIISQKIELFVTTVAIASLFSLHIMEKLWLVIVTPKFNFLRTVSISLSSRYISNTAKAIRMTHSLEIMELQ
jgi:hypothetical protein